MSKRKHSYVYDDPPTAVSVAEGQSAAKEADSSEVFLLSRSLPVKDRCATCAFRLGTVPNVSEGVAIKALICASDKKPFLCHEGLEPDEEPHAACAGWSNIVSAWGIKRQEFVDED